jgi:hypothetical protein
MSGEAEAVGAAITAGLVSSAVEDPEARKGARGQCINCGAPLAGNYCSKCGQPAHVHRKLGHMAAEFLHNLFHLDTRAWRTLPLLMFRPGQLTHDYIHGKRARYISPLAMFLLSVFTMILVFEAVGGSRIGVGGNEAAAESITSEIVDVEERLAEARTELAERESSGADAEDLAEAREWITDSETELAALRAALAAAKVADAKAANAKAAADARRSEYGPSSADISAAVNARVNAQVPPKPEGLELDGEGSIYDQIRKQAESGEVNVDTGWPMLDAKIKEKLLNPELAVYKIQNMADNFAFLLVPISLPFIWLMFFWKRGVTLFDHTVYILYSLSFVSILFVLIALSGAIGMQGWLIQFLMVGALVHSFFHLKGGYGLGWFSALWRLPVQLIFSAIALTVFVLVILILGLVG